VVAHYKLRADAIAQFTTRCEYGFMLNKTLPRRISNELRRMDKLSVVGRVAQWRQEEEVREFDGENGSPKWITLGDMFYDISGRLSIRFEVLGKPC
jgi:hypothetical protein